MDTETTERAANFSFTKCQIPVGEEIEYAYDPSLKAKVVGDRAAEFNGVTMFLIAFTKQLSGKKYPVIGPRYFKYKGEWLNSIRERLGV